MAVTSQLTSIEDFEAPGATFTASGYGSGGGASDNTDIFIEGSQSGGRRVDNITDKGFGVTFGSTNLSAANVHIKVWFWVTQWPQVSNVRIRISDGTNDDDHTFPSSEYPPLGGFVPIWVDVSRTPETGGSANEAAITEIGSLCDMGNVGGAADNFILDEITYGTSGYLWDGTSGSLSSFRTFETSNNEGVLITNSGVDFCYSRLEIGSATATTFTDSGFQLIYPDQGLVASTFMGLTIDLQNASTAVTLSDALISSGNVSSATNRPDFLVSGTSGTLDCTGVTFSGMRTIELNDACTMDTCIFTSCGVIDATNSGTSGADLSNSTVSNSIVGTAAAALLWNVNADPDGNLDNMNFTKGSGTTHAIEFGSNTPSSITLRGINFSGYNASNGNNDSTFYNNSGGALTINLVDCTGNLTYRNGASATTTINVSVNIEINGVTEGSRCAMIGNGGAEDGNVLLQGYADSTGKITGSFSGTTPQNVFIRARNSGIVAAVIQDDGTVFTDYTDEAREQVGSNDVVLLPAVPAVGDATYIGGLAQFGEVLFNISTAGSTYIGTWEYWNGAWTALTVVDNTNSFQTTGWNTMNFTIPSDWATTTINSQGPYYYIRFRVTTGGGSGGQAEYLTLNETTKYLPFNSTGTIASGTGLTATAVWIQDTFAN